MEKICQTTAKDLSNDVSTKTVRLADAKLMRPLCVWFKVKQS